MQIQIGALLGWNLELPGLGFRCSGTLVVVNFGRLVLLLLLCEIDVLLDLFDQLIDLDRLLEILVAVRVGQLIVSDFSENLLLLLLLDVVGGWSLRLDLDSGLLCLG